MTKTPTNEELEAQAKAKGAVFVNESMFKASIDKVDFIVHPGSQLTICVITMVNGYTVTGESACADPKMFDAEIGQKFAFAAAERKIWPLLGYVMKDRLYKAGQGTSYQDRVRLEMTELTDKIEKLKAFVNGNEQFQKLSTDEKGDLTEQLQAMRAYQYYLQKRINRFE